jgi:hypothetical protein
MTLRQGHGSGAGSPRIEVLPPDELPAASPAVAVRVDRGPDGRFRPGNDVGRSKRLRPGLHGLTGIDTASPEFRVFGRWGARYAAHRRRELASSHGGEISTGVGALVESAALDLAAARYLQWKATHSGEVDGFKAASALAATARQNELAAWELAAREAKARPIASDPMWSFLQGKK